MNDCNLECQSPGECTGSAESVGPARLCNRNARLSTGKINFSTNVNIGLRQRDAAKAPAADCQQELT